MSTNFGIVGTGSIATVHAEAISQIDHAKLVACCARTPESGRRFSRVNNCDYESDLGSLLTRDDCDVIVITTPSGTHADIGILAAKHGKHVFCEKPLDISVGKIDQLIAACAANNVLLGTIFQSRFGRGARALKRAIEQGRFGKLAQCSAYIPWYRDEEYYESIPWHGTHSLDGGALLNQGIHAVDLLLWLVGEVQAVSGRVQTRIHDIETEDNATAWLQFVNGSLGVIQCSTACYPGESKRVDIRGERGSVTLVDDVPVSWEFESSTPEDAEIDDLRMSATPSQGASDPKAISIDGHVAQYRDFIAAISEGRQPAISGQEGRRSVEVIRAIYESSKSSSIVQIPLKPHS